MGALMEGNSGAPSAEASRRDTRNGTLASVPFRYRGDLFSERGRSGLTGLICLLSRLGVGQLLLDLFQVLSVERGAHLAERPLGFTQVQRSSVEVDADQAHGASLSPTPRSCRSGLEVD